MRIIICDDNIAITNQLHHYILDYFVKNKLTSPEISIFYSGDELLQDTGCKDIVFLDVEMPGISGIHVGKSLKSQNKNTIIFIVTAFTEYLDDAMRFHVFRYLTKPIDKARLFRNFKDALKKYNTDNTTICIETKAGNFTTNIADIIMIEAQGRKTIARTRSKDYESIHTMSHWLHTLISPCFFHAHRSYIINLKYVDNFDNTTIFLFNQQFSAYLTRRKYKQFKDSYLLYLESMR